MYFRFTLFNVITLCVMAATVVMAIKRFQLRLDTNWPLLYYAILVTYSRGFQYSLNEYWLFTGVACGLFLRFEFLGGIFEKAIRAVELAVFAYVLWRCLGLILLWW